MTSTQIFVSIFLITGTCVVLSVQQYPEAHSRIVQRGFIDYNRWDCSDNEECTAEGSFCYNITVSTCVTAQCQCPSNAVFNAEMTACIKGAEGYGDVCQESSQCVAYLGVGGLCNQGFCSCSKGYYYIGGSCKKASGLSQKCATDDDCYVNADYRAYSCSAEACACASGYYQREYRSCRLKAMEKGAECTIDSDCKYDKKAKCDKKSGCYVPSKNETLKNPLRAPTTRQFQPIYFSTSGKKSCSKDSDCILNGGGWCNWETECICFRGSFWDPIKLGCVAELGTDCETADSPVIKNSICRSEIWSCKGATVPSNNNQVCLDAATTLADYCEHDEQCYVFGPDASCTGNKCGCNENSHYSYEHKFCWVNKALGEKCKVNEDCYSSFSDSMLMCNNKSTCACPPGTHINVAGSGCVKDVPIPDDPCTGQSDCKGLQNSKCSKGMLCSCEQSYFKSSNKCVKGIDAPCKSNNECQAVNSACVSNKCSCIDKHVRIGIELCLPGVAFNGTCQYNVQCLANTNETFCDMYQTCTCHRDHRYRNGQCRGIKYLGDVCDYSTDDCWSRISNTYNSKSMSCNIDHCRCNGGYSPSYNWLDCYPDKKSSNGSPKKELFGWIGLIMLSTRLIGLL